MMLKGQFWLLSLVLTCNLLETSEITIKKDLEHWSEWASWSPCSAPCGPGISTRTRDCLRSVKQGQDISVSPVNTDLCNGTNNQVKVCDLKTCPPDWSSARQTSCSHYNSRMFSGMQYVFEPVIHPTDPCRLSCRAKGKHFYANLANRVEDGFPCNVGIIDSVCIKGVCKPVGCDGVVESKAVKDACGICKGDGSSCQTISGIFTSMDLKPGVNYVISIPARSTSINITELTASRSKFILKTVDGKPIISNDTSSPETGALDAAGTVFRHGARNRQNTIYSPGPTNVTVVLELLVRGTNPGVMYTFSVPKEVSGEVIQQLRYRLQLGERRLGSSHGGRILHSSGNRDAYSISGEKHITESTYTHLPNFKKGDSTSLKKQTAGSSYTDSPNIKTDDSVSQDTRLSEYTSSPYTHHLVKSTEHSSRDNKELNMKSNTRIFINNSPHTLEEEMSEQTAFQSLSTKHFNKISGNDVKGAVILNSRGDSGNPRNLSIQRHAKNLQGVTKNFDENSSYLQQGDSLNYDQIINTAKDSTKEPDFGLKNFNINRNNRQKASDTNLLSSREVLLSSSDQALSNELNVHGKNDIRDGNAVADHFTGYRNGLSSLQSEKVKDILKDHQVGHAEYNLYLPENELMEGSMQSVSIPLASVVDPKEIQNWNPDSRSSVNEKINKSQSSILARSGTQRYHMQGNVADETDKETITRNQQFSNWNKLGDMSVIRSADTNMHSNFAVAGTHGPLEKGSDDSSTDKMAAVTQSSPLTVSPTENGRGLPSRFLQNVRFAERYTGTYSRDPTDISSWKPHETEHPRRHYSSFQNGSHNISSGTSSGNVYDKVNESASQNERTTDRSRSVNSHKINSENNPSKDSNTEFGDRTNNFSTPSHTNTDIHRSTEERHNERVTSLQNHNTVLEERKRRMEEQRHRYNERLREYQERIRQRHAEINASRLRSLLPDAAQVNLSNSYNSLPQRRQVLFQTGPLLQNNTRNQTSLALLQTHYSFLSHKQGQPSISGRLDAVQMNLEFDDSLSKNREVIFPTEANLVARNGPRSDTNIYNVTSPKHAEKEASVILNTQQPSKNGENSFYVKQQVIRDWKSDLKSREAHNASSSDPRSLQIVPRIRHSKHQVDNKSSNGDISQKDISRTFQRLNTSGPQYLPDSALPAAAVLPPGVKEIQLGQLSGDISNNNHILPKQLPLGRFPTFETQELLRHSPPIIHNTVYEWRVSGLTECTHSCGGGTQQTVVVCVNTLTQVVVTDDNCRHIIRPKLSALPCNKRPCSAEWVPGSWSPCSASCGSGYQTRITTCQVRVSPTLNMTMPSSSCEDQERIPDRQTCNNNPCSSWQVGTWSNCSTSCGDGQKTRDVLCVTVDNKTVTDHICSEIKPHSQEPCNFGECGRGWFFTDWTSECSQECGIGVVTRQVFCGDETGSSLPDSSCDSHRPASTQPCRSSSACSGMWFTGQWSKCDVKCGVGHIRRNVLCINELSAGVHALVGPENCEKVAKPAEMEPCHLPSCHSEWYQTSWSQCSQSCGTGHRTREVKCLDTDNKPADDCSLQTRPKTREACNTHSCDHVSGSNGELSDCTDTIAECRVVKRARLCRFSYYRTKCCKSCREETYDIS